MNNSEVITSFVLPKKILRLKNRVQLDGINGKRIRYKMGLIREFFPREAKILCQLRPKEKDLMQVLEHIANKTAYERNFKINVFELDIIRLGLKILAGFWDYGIIKTLYESFVELFPYKLENSSIEKEWKLLNDNYNNVRKAVRAKIAIWEILAWHWAGNSVENVINIELIQCSPRFLGSELIQDWISRLQSKIKRGGEKSKRFNDSEAATAKEYLMKIGEVLLGNMKSQKRERKDFRLWTCIQVIQSDIARFKSGSIKLQVLVNKIKEIAEHINSYHKSGGASFDQNDLEEIISGNANRRKELNVRETAKDVLSVICPESFVLNTLSRVEDTVNRAKKSCLNDDIIFLIFLLQESGVQGPLSTDRDLLEQKVQNAIENQKLVNFDKDSVKYPHQKN